MTDNHEIEIHIDKMAYKVESQSLTGAQLRDIPKPPIGSQYDLYEEVPGGTDILVNSAVSYALHNGMHFFTAPSTINPG
jgi:hypothetical protein